MLSRRVPSIGAYLHLHPATVTDGQGRELTLAPLPSPADRVVFGNLSACAQAPLVFPIRTYGPAAPGRCVRRMSVSGFDAGCLKEIGIEVGVLG